ncbi:MAG: isoprenylcysteine carboxylmethyltransferase family protein [Candidatus Lokiarchaeota archaeon]|nr:isoprenylcysteine carboxylmethyltransferase family protein [Candidatus Harpocratesius repetitus]
MIGYFLFFIVLKENSFAGKTVKIDKERQRVITTGPYSHVRHPMYSAIILMFVMAPIALGSFWALIFSAILILTIFYRIKDEEKMLIEELEG